MHGSRNLILCAGLCFLSCGLIMGSAARAERAPILVDGTFPDWDPIAPAYTDASGDGGGSGIDLGRLWVADDARFLFLRFEVGPELLLNDGHPLTLYLDTDANSQTGLAVGGIGAELEWRFGDRAGTYRYNNQPTAINQDDIRFRAQPTVTAPSFEAAIGRDTRPDGAHPLFLGTTIRILFMDTGTGGDRLPNNGDILAYTMDQGTLPQEFGIPLGRERADDLRIATINVKQDSPWSGGNGVKYDRLLSAVVPEILNFQEIYNHNATQVRDLVESWLPSGAGQAWYAAGNNDCKTVSRFPVIQTWALDGNLAVLLDTTPSLGSQLLIVNAHLPCCSENQGRQAEIDRILSFLRDAKTPGGLINLDPNTPFLVTGDLNLVTLSQQLNSLLTGNIQDEGNYGSDFPIDWDGTEISDLISRQTEKRMSYTWRSDTSTYWPGRLDFMIYTDSVLDVGNHFLIYTPEMPPDTLVHYGLQVGDSQATDHLLTCSDLRPLGMTDTTELMPREVALRVSPNPTRLGVRIALALPEPAETRVVVLDPTGRIVAHPLGDGWVHLQAGTHPIYWDGNDDRGRRLPAGVYFVRARGRDGSGSFTREVKGILLR